MYKIYLYIYIFINLFVNLFVHCFLNLFVRQHYKSVLSLASIIDPFASLSQRLSRKAWRRGAAAAACRIRCAPSFATAKALRKVLQLA